MYLISIIEQEGYIPLFITQDLEKAEKYRERFLSLLLRLRNHYKKFENGDGTLKEECIDSKVDSWVRLSEVYSLTIDLIEERWKKNLKSPAQKENS